MSRVATGDYKVEFYDGYGAKLRDLSDTAVSLGAGHMKAKAVLIGTLDDGDLSTAKSYTLDRRIYNSLEGP
jgi:hypothetical protein